MKQFSITFFVSLFLLGAAARGAELKPKTIAAFDKYVAATEQRFSGELKPGGSFLYIDALSAQERDANYARLKNGEILVEQSPGQNTRCGAGKSEGSW